MTHQIIKYTQSFDRLVVLTKEDMATWKKTNKNVYQIYNPLPYEAAEQSHLDNHIIISVGRLNPQKNYFSLIQAWRLVHSRYPEWEINIWGDGEQKEQLQQEIESYGLENTFHLCGRTDNIKDKYLQSSIYVMSSIYEGFAMVLLEAATFGLPIISYDCPCGPKEIIDNGKNGIIVSLHDFHALAAAICRLIENESLRKRMGHQSKVTSHAFSQDKILPQWPAFFEELIAG